MEGEKSEWPWPVSPVHLHSQWLVLRDSLSRLALVVPWGGGGVAERRNLQRSGDVLYVGKYSLMECFPTVSIYESFIFLIRVFVQSQMKWNTRTLWAVQLPTSSRLSQSIFTFNLIGSRIIISCSVVQRSVNIVSLSVVSMNGLNCQLCSRASASRIIH